MTRVSVAVLGLLAAACGSASTPASHPSTEHESGTKTGASGAPSGSALVMTDSTPSEEDRAGRGEEWGIMGAPSYSAVVDKVVGMVNDPAAHASVQRRGLDVMNVMWEDTGREHGSSVGPNISDLTLQVRYRRAANDGETSALMPVIRFPNFTDRTGDVPAGKFFVRVGNHRDAEHLKTVPLTEILRNLRGFASKPWSIGGTGNLLAKRDTHFLVSAQAVFLPIPKQGKAEFNPVVFNYQSAPGSPAVLTLLVTRQGTSMTVVENSPEDATVSGWGQELYFNNEGQRAALTAERKSDVEQRIAAQGGPQTADDRSAIARGADVLFLVQVPLKHRERGYMNEATAYSPGSAGAVAKSSAAPAPPMAARAAESDVEQAVLGHGENRGAFTEGNGVRIERDERFPIRITVQFYKATSNGVVSERDLDAIASSIGSVYEHADYVGSLVLPDGDPARPTEWQKMPREWFPW